jgi:hypothetical protein
VIVARYAGTAELADMVGDAVRVHQSNFAAVSAAIVFAGILERVIVLNSTVQARPLLCLGVPCHVPLYCPSGERDALLILDLFYLPFE